MSNFLSNIGPTELIIIGIMLVVFFGSKKITELGKVGGETVKEVKKIKKEFNGAIEEVKKEPADDKDKGEGVSK
jgi:Sec-independent protein translocase protein TatA